MLKYIQIMPKYIIRTDSVLVFCVEKERSMNAITQKAVRLMDVLPERDQNLALELIKKLVLAWDPDFKKLIITEQKELEEARLDEETVSHDRINWD